MKTHFLFWLDPMHACMGRDQHAQSDCRSKQPIILIICKRTKKGTYSTYLWIAKNYKIKHKQLNLLPHFLSLQHQD